MTTYTQQGRLLSVDTPLGQDVLLLTGFEGQEGMSQMFQFTLNMSSTQQSIAPTDIVGKRVTVSLRLPDDSERFFNGVVSRFAYLGRDDRLNYYSAEVVPWVWLLTRRTNCRIYQNKSVKQIIEAVFSDLGFTDFEDGDVQGSHPTWDYCVQYRESDFNFISRLMEREGIFYFFRHENGKHTLVLADQKGVYRDVSDSQPEYTEENVHAQLKSWQHGYEYRSGKYTQTDYNFETPSSNLTTDERTVLKVDGISSYELFDYPGNYAKKGDGQTIAKFRMEEDEVAYDVVSGTSHCRSFSPGGKFTLKTHPSPAEQGKSFVITSIAHNATMGGSYVTGAAAGEDNYLNDFKCIPSSVVFRAPRTTAAPFVRGVQTAVVVGPTGEEIYTDKYGRVKVQFRWDRDGKKNESSSCWIRVGQPWAGNTWGTISIPRIGDEVIVDFLEGDPDRPIITGSVYNAERMPPYDLPGNATRTAIKTRSSKSGGASNYNELCFEDKAGSEDISFHAERDFHRVVEHDDDLQVGNNQTITVQKSRTETVQQGDESVTIEKGNRSVTVSTGNDTHDIQQGDRNVKIKMGNDSLSIQMGNQTTKLDLGSSSTEAMQSIELKVGQNSIKIDQTGVTISGLMISIQGQIQTQVSGMMTQISGSGMLQMSGGITMIG